MLMHEKTCVIPIFLQRICILFRYHTVQCYFVNLYLRNRSAPAVTW